MPSPQPVDEAVGQAKLISRSGPALFIIDPVKLTVTSKPLKNLPGRVIGSGFVNGVYYLFTESGHIVTYDLATGPRKPPRDTNRTMPMVRR